MSSSPTTVSATAESTTAATSIAGKYLTLLLDHEAYGIAVLLVREIIRVQKITPVPQLPPHVKGVINLRGRVIPIMDLRLKFGLKAEFSERTCIVVVQVTQASREVVQMGLIVDSVEEVVILNDEAIQPTPDFGVQVSTEFILGMAKVKGQVTTLLDISRVVVADAGQLGRAVVG